MAEVLIVVFVLVVAKILDDRAKFRENELDKKITKSFDDNRD